jgi:hypothetical protein
MMEFLGRSWSFGVWIFQENELQGYLFNCLPYGMSAGS